MLSAVKTEEGWAQSPPAPVSCQLSKQTHSPPASCSPGDNRGTARVQVPGWGPAAQGETWSRLLKSSRVGLSGPQGSASTLGRGTQTVTPSPHPP